MHTFEKQTYINMHENVERVANEHATVVRENCANI